uniref:HYDIN axonemal central pair apparatus protein n=1 Tax=Astyanax mexicanus TaxID=7994 RepID=W5LN16_ASTMX
MSQTTEERLANTYEMHPPRILELLDMSITTHQKFSSLDVDQPLFQPYPSEIVFQNFLPSEMYKVPLVLRNNDKIPRLVKVVVEDSLYFKVISTEDVGSKVAPGLTCTFTVLFTPQENKDYIHRLICVTERETFEVPIRAIGVRAILDFPDQVHFPPCPVKGLTQKTLLVRNIGNGEANFQLSTQRPFSVEPAVGTLGGGHSMQVTIDFLPRVTGDHSQQLLLHYHTGEDVYISLYGTSIDVSVRLDRNSVLVEKTYITMANQRRVAILNRSDTIVHYQWKSFATEDEEEFCSELQPEEDNEMEQILTEGDTDLTLRDHLFQQRRRQLHQDSLVFSDQHIIMEPQEGDIWPKQTAEINIIFKPQEARLYQEIVYCDITGREARLPLRIKAEGIGPKLQFNFVELDMKNVFIGSKNCYEVLVSNKGLIDAPYRLVPPSTAMGLCFSFNPAEGMVPPGACHALEVCFSSDNLGIFSEEFYFMVEGNPQPLSLTFRGCVIGPTFHFSDDQCFPQTLTCRLSNTSLVPMSFGMRIPGDGMGKDSVTSSEQVSQFNRNNWRPGDRVAERPQEFKVTPRSGAIRALSHKDIQVTFCSNTVQEYSMSLVVDVEGVGEEVLALPIKARCLVPEVHLERRLLEFQNCFMNYPYQKSVTLINVSDLPAYHVCLCVQEYEENPSLLFSSPQPRGVIEPCSRVEIPLVLQAKALGQLHHTAFFALLGQQGPPLELLLSCIGQGPAISLSATKLHFGNIPVLTDVPRSLRLSNHSPVPACFHAQMAGSRSQWRVEPAEGKVAPDGHVELRLVAHLDDTLPFQDTLQLVIQDSQTQTVDVSATGTGTTIITDRPFAPSLDLGGHFSSRPCQYHFRVTNRGRRLHQLFWSTEGFPQFHRKSLPLKNTSRNGKAKSPLVTPLLDAPVFTLTPIWLKLDPGESADMLLEGFADTPKVVRERLVCLANVEHETAKKRIMTVDITCQFIAPVLDISSQQLSFYVEKVPDMPLVPLYERLLLKSTSTLPLSMELTLAEPFGLCDHTGDNTFATSKIELWVRFDPSYQSDLVSRVAEVVLEVQYSGHPKRDYVALRGEVHFPNVHFSSSVLDFGCVLNHTEAQQQITMTNCSPLPVSYHWTFLLDQQQICISSAPVPHTQIIKSTVKHFFAFFLLFVVSNNIPTHFLPPSFLSFSQVFDISPIFGVLRPGESQLVTFSFFGNPDISAEVLALCQVEHGPTYEIILRGEASLVTYALDTTDINLGYQLFDRVSEAEVTIKNTGRVGFDFSALLDDEQLSSENPLPGQPLVIPSKGHIEANTEMRLTVYYLPGIPEVFEKTFLLQVAFFEPEVITLRGEGIFPRVVLDLPRDLGKGFVTVILLTMDMTPDLREKILHTVFYDALLQMEVERLLVKEHAITTEKSQRDTRLSETSISSSKWYKKFVLPEYVLDFGFVIHGSIHTHIVKVTNTGPAPVSFRAKLHLLAGTGFSTELDRVKNLPYCETETFEVKFDPLGANLELGEITTILPIQVLGGPMVQVRLRAVVTMPSLTVSTDVLQFDNIQCGLCQVVTVQLHNPEQVPCEWSFRVEEQPKKKPKKNVPLRLRQKARFEQLPSPAVFEMLPSKGVLYPGDRVNVQVKFSPTEGRAYKEKLVVAVAQSTQRILLLAQGHGEEPQLEFSTSLLELGPVLPYSAGEEAEVVVRNLCHFPIEFYSLDFDTQYLEEEKILRMMKGYDAQNMLLLPPRAPGQPLPAELLDYYKEHQSQEPDLLSIILFKEGGTVSSVGDLEMDPVSRAIARHVGIDLSPDGQAARNRRGIAIIVHGAPLSGKSSLAVSLAKQYGAACLNIDGVVQEAVSSGVSTAAMQARELCGTATVELTQGTLDERGEAFLKAHHRNTLTKKSNKEKLNIYTIHFILLAYLQAAQVQRRPSESVSLMGEMAAISSLLPDDLLIEILSERLQLSDCHCGVVIDSLETLYCCSPSSVLQIVLKAFNNRKHIYVIDLNNNYHAFKAEERARVEANCEANRHLLYRFRLYEQSLPQIQHVLQHWDRTQGLLLQSFSSEEQAQENEEVAEQQVTSGKKNKKEREKEKVNRERQEKEKQKVELPSTPPSQTHLLFDDTEATKTELIQEIIPLICISASEKELLCGTKLLSSLKLPSLEEVVQDLLGAYLKSIFVFDIEISYCHSKGEVTLRICFNSTAKGSFEQTLSFEVMGTKRCYQLCLRGICDYPSISKDHKTVFAHCKKVLQPEDGLQKTYIVRSGLYDFGPVLCGKNRDRYKEKYPENTERLVIHNNSPLEAEVNFLFQHDTKATTFFLDPPSMVLKPKEKKELTVLAYPTSPGLIEDSVVCCIKENPEPVIFRFVCRGVRPELEVERRQLHFDKTLLHRRETRSLCLRNPTALPVAWKLSGLEVLGDEFSVSQDHGVIMPQSEFSLNMYFKAVKSISLKKTIHLEVSDVGNILGLVHTENIQVIAEAYDVALDTGFPQGGLDFGSVKVGEEVKISTHLKNKGKYEIKKSIDGIIWSIFNLNSVFTITPQRGSLLPSDRPTTVQFIFCHNREVSIRDQPILKCQVIEPNVGGIVAVIPINVSAQCLFSKYSITPPNSVNFGALVYGSRKTRNLTVENLGEFEIRFTISRTSKGPPGPAQRNGDSQSAKPFPPNKLRRADSVQKDTVVSTQGRMSMGVFTVSPCLGLLPPGGKQLISVDCVAEHVGFWHECLAVDITDRDPSDSPGGIPYSLVADICVPEIASKDIASIFEEHRLCQNSNMLHCEQYRNAVSIFIQEENKFVFNNVLVGQLAKARLRLTNPGKVPCELSLQVKSVLAKTSERRSDAFEVTPTRLSIASYSHDFVTITFCPQAMQTYLGVFEATLEGASGYVSKVLVFDLLGDGNLPSITVVKPVQRTSQGQPVLQFNRLLVGSRQTLPLVIKNISSVPAQISFDLLDKMGVFGLRSAPNTTSTLMAHVASLTLKAGQQAEFEVQFCPEVAQSFNASLRLVVQDNHYEVILVQLLGEGYHDIISLDNISNKVSCTFYLESNLLNFGDCHVSRLYNETFTMSNHSNIEVIRFEWPPDVPQLRFSPRIGHLHAGCTKEVTVSFISEQPVVLSTQVVKCKLSRITFQQPVDQVPDWDDRRHTIKWVDADRQALPQQPAKKKVVETDPEPDHTVVDNCSRELELTVSAVCDYAKFECQAKPIHFKDTTLYQTRVFHSLASVSALLLGNPDLPPFSVEPSVGIIKPGATETFCVRFCPLEIAEYEARLHCSIPNLKEGQGLTITASGLSLLPYCHFHLKDSDYLSGNRRSPDLRVALDPNTKVVEFSSTGINTFSIVNPTNKPYSFLWKCEDTRTKPFTCLTPKNTIQPGKKVEVSFKFHPQELDLVESFWTFLIPEHKLSVPFLLVGTANEPVVYIDHAHLNLGSLLIGQETRRTVYMVNGEDQPFSFSILDVSCRSEPLGDSLLLETMEGTVSPRDKLPLVISFTPTQEGAVMFNLLVTVTGRVQPLTLNIKAEGYSMNASVHCKDVQCMLLKTIASVCFVNSVQVELSETSTCSFVVYNPGKFSLDVRYELTGPTDLQRHLQVDPKTAIVPVGRQDRCILSFFPLQNCILKDMRFSIRVINGATFCCSLLGAATAPGLEFSFLKYNFGMNFIYSAGMVPATHTLVISNKGEKGISVNCLFSNTPSLKASFTPEVLPPGGSMEVLFTFYPREAVQYHEKVVFEINKCAKQVVEILGQGIAMKIDVEDPQHKVVKLGALQVGQKCRKLIPLINNSDSYLTFSLLFTPTAHALLDPGVFSMRPEREVTLPGRGGRCKVEVVFTPQQRMAPFSEELQLKCLGTVCPLLVLKGCCHGVEVTLDQGYLRFGAVCRNCKATRRIILQNTGDIGARFEWDVQSFAPDFSICPAKGYITPGMELPLEVTFAPVEVKQNVRYDNLCCSIEGGKPVTITLAGSCIPPQVVLNFACQVRSQCTQSLSLSNPSNQSWNLQPVLEGEYWSAAPFFVVEPYQQNKAYEITYEPMTMTTDGKKHLGSVFFAFPDGAGMLYTLQGTTEPPKAVGTISGEVPCKTLYTEMIPVQNWLHKPQRFRVLMEMVNPDRPDNTVSLKGLDYMDVPALAKRDYKISFFSYKEGQYNAKVTFKNEVTGEYLFYNLSFKATPPGVMSTVEMVASVRQTTSACVEVENPLPTNVVFSVECRSPDISVQSQLSVSALSKVGLDFEYQPLCIGESTTRLTLQNSELGSFHYELLLRALPAPPEKPLYFKAPLGSSQYLTAKFTSYSRVKTEYTCKTDCPDFFVEKTVSAAAAGSQTGSDVSVKVHFEPSQLGEVRGLLTVSSSLGGDYLFPLYGTCTPPKPQGPLTIYAGSHVTIPFKNVFPQAAAFSFQVNNPAFTVKGADTIQSKKTHNIVVSFEGPPEGSKTLCTGKLTISSPRTDGHGQAIFWVYYLKGICPEQPQREK